MLQETKLFLNNRTCPYFWKILGRISYLQYFEVHRCLFTAPVLSSVYQMWPVCTWDGWVSQNVFHLNSSTKGTEYVLQSQDLWVFTPELHKSVLVKWLGVGALLMGSSPALWRCPSTCHHLEWLVGSVSQFRWTFILRAQTQKELWQSCLH